MSKTYEFDVAISFLSDDEIIASQINDELSKNFNVFFFPNNQRDIAGKDGVDTFSEVFLKKSRLNIVLFRQKWGKTDWTRVEETAIKSRIFNGDGWDSLFLIKLDNAEIPNWIPPTYIYAPTNQYPIEQLIPILKFRIEERGGILKEESLVEAAKRIQSEHTLKKYIHDYLSSEKAVSDAESEVVRLLNLFESEYNNLKESSPDLAIGELKKASKELHFHFPINGTYIHFKWKQYFRNTLKNSKLEVILYPKNNHQEVISYDFTMNNLKQIGWKNSNIHEFIASEKIVEYWMREHLELVAINREKNLFR